MSYNLEQAYGSYKSYGAAGLATGTNTGTFKTTATLSYTNNGAFKSKSATDNLAFSSGHKAVPAGSACAFSVWIDAAGAVTTTQGNIVGSGETCSIAPAAGTNVTFVGYIKVTTNASTTFTPGTTGLGAAGITAAYQDCAVMPGTPV